MTARDPSGTREADTYASVVDGSSWPPAPPDANVAACVPRPPVTSWLDVSGISRCQPLSPSNADRIAPTWLYQYPEADSASAVDGHCQIASDPWIAPRAPDDSAHQQSCRIARSCSPE